MAKTKLGLVLEGGGAKGAYQFGALKKFVECGIAFDCVSGSSVGGLNAAIFSSGKMQDGEKLWSTLRQDKIYPWRLPRPLLVLGYIMATAIIFLSSIVYYLQGARKIHIKPAWRWALGILGLCFCALTFAIWSNDSVGN